MKGAKKMTAREKAQLERLLQKKEQEEAATKAFFTQIKRRRKEVVHALGLEEAEAAYTALQVKAEQAGASMNEFLSFVQKLPPEWIYKQTHRGE